MQEKQKKPSLKEQLEQMLGTSIEGNLEDYNYNGWLEIFRKVPAAKIVDAKEWLNMNLPVEGYAAANRWIEIIGKPTRMDKLYQGQLRANQKDSIMDLAIGDDDEAFYEALIRENVEKLDESRNSAQEVARITQNLNIFRKQLRDIRSRKPKKGSVLEQVLQLAAQPPKAPEKPKESARKPKKKAAATTKKKSPAKTPPKKESKPSA